MRRRDRMRVSGYASASLVARKGQRRGISGCSFCEYLKSRRVVERGCAAPHGCTMEFSILCREIALINETTWPSETLFVTACGRYVYRGVASAVILYPTDWIHLTISDRHIAVNWIASFELTPPIERAEFPRRATCVVSAAFFPPDLFALSLPDAI